MPRQKLDLSRPPRTSQNEVAALRQRATKAAAQSRARVSINIRVSVPLYKALVELSEEAHQPINTVALQCLEDGTRKYKSFSGSELNPFARITPLRQAPQTSHGHALSQTPMQRIAELARLKQPAAYTPVDDDAQDAALAQQVAETLASFPAGALIPSTPPLPDAVKEHSFESAHSETAEDTTV
jgi:hypothetical protein